MRFTYQSPGSVPPAMATLVSPTGTITTASPTFTWNAVAGASWYYLWVDDVSGTRLTQWYTAAQVGCSGGTGTCTMSPALMLNSGTAHWWIQTWDSAGYGPWSKTSTFSVP